MKIKYYDLIALAGIHTGINVALLKIFMMSFKDYNSIDFYAEPKHSSICKDKLKDKTVNFHSMRLMPRKLFGGGGKMILRDAFSCIYVIQAFLRSNKKDVLVFSLVYPFAQALIYGLINALKRKQVYVCLHGEMEVIIDDRKFKSKNYQKITKYILKKKSDINYIVFGESIFQNLKHLFTDTSKVIIIEHPYEFEEKHLLPTVYYNPLIIGQIGMGEKSKGTNYLFELAKLLETEIKENKIKVKLVGKLNSQLIPLDNGLVEFHKNFLDDETFKKEINSLHFTLQLVPLSKRKVTASGSFFDTLKYQKPYLSLENEYISYFHTKQPNSGVIFNSINEMANYIKQLLSTDYEQLDKQYQSSIDAIRNLQETLSLSNIAEKFKQQITNYK
jgi:glycosyltransferase involved in cell wall biosynthesis